jgi:hypothetical protein
MNFNSLKEDIWKLRGSTAFGLFHKFLLLFQEAAWKSHQWKKGRELAKSKKPRRKFNFKQIAR